MGAPPVEHPPAGGWVSVAARLPAALLPVGVLSAGAGTGSVVVAALLTSVALIGLALSVPAAGAAAERFGQRAVLLSTAGLHVTLLVLLLALLPRLETRPGEQPDTMLLLVAMIFCLAAGLTAPAVGTMSRARGWHLHHRRPDQGVAAARWMRREASIDEILLVVSALLVALFAGALGPGAGLMLAALLGALAVPASAMDPLAVMVEEDLHQHLPDDGPLEPLRVALPAVEHGQQMVAEARGLSPESPGQPTHPVGPVASVPERAERSGGPDGQTDPGRLPAALLVSLGLGISVGGVGLIALVASEHAHRPGALGLLLGLWAAAAVVSSRRLPRRLAGLDVPRRRRLFAVLHAVLAILLTGVVAAALARPGGLLGLVVVAVLVIGLGVCLGVLLVEVYRVVAQRAPVADLVSTLSSVAGALLVGMVVGLTAGGLLAVTAGVGWTASALLVGALVPAAVALRPARRAGPGQGSASRTASL